MGVQMVIAVLGDMISILTLTMVPFAKRIFPKHIYFPIVMLANQCRSFKERFWNVYNKQGCIELAKKMCKYICIDFEILSNLYFKRMHEQLYNRKLLLIQKTSQHRFINWNVEI